MTTDFNCSGVLIFTSTFETEFFILAFGKHSEFSSNETLVIGFLVFCFFFQAKEQQASMEEKFHNELNAHIKLSNLYKVNTLPYIFVP